MKISVFTPTHNPAYLHEVWACLLAQTYQDWEWVVVPNGDLAEPTASVVQRLVGDDKRVRIVTPPIPVHGIGALKKYACDQCRGDLLLEYDHDDLITDDCFEAVVEAARRSPAVSFIYSDDVTMDFEHRTHYFMKEYGWRQYDWEYKGRKYEINAQPEPHPRNLCEILYAPDHVRVWTRQLYKLVGGHNPVLEVGDDHELLVRSYLTGAHFEHIKRPLYLHRLAKTNTSQQKLKRIGELSIATRDKYFHALVKEWCRREGRLMFDLGGAHNCEPGFLPIDLHLPAGTPYRGDVFTVLASSVADNSVGCFRAADFLEHIPARHVNNLMNLLYRKLAPGGFLLTHTPAVCDNEGRCGRGSFQDPDHKSFWSSNNFWYFTDRAYAKYQNGAVKCRFQTVRVANYYPSEFHKLHLIPYVLWDGMALKDDDAHYLMGPKLI